MPGVPSTETMVVTDISAGSPLNPPTHTTVCDMVVRMQVDRFSVTMEPDLGAAVRDAAQRAGMSVSGWLAQAAADRLRNDLLGAALDAWEAEDGAFGDEELDAAAATLGLTRGSRGHTA